MRDRIKVAHQVTGCGVHLTLKRRGSTGSGHVYKYDVSVAPHPAERLACEFCHARRGLAWPAGDYEKRIGRGMRIQRGQHDDEQRDRAACPGSAILKDMVDAAPSPTLNAWDLAWLERET